MSKYDYVFGIDPDVEKSGIARLRTYDRVMNVETFTFSELIEELHDYKICLGDAKAVFVVEASWIVQSNWHLSQWERKQRAAAKGYDVGRNHETGRKIVEMCKHFGLEVVEHIPLRKCWNGKDRKITHEEITQFIPTLPKRTNQEERDAALLAWSFANFPIRVKG